MLPRCAPRRWANQFNAQRRDEGGAMGSDIGSWPLWFHARYMAERLLDSAQGPKSYGAGIPRGSLSSWIPSSQGAGSRLVLISSQSTYRSRSTRTAHVDQSSLLVRTFTKVARACPDSPQTIFSALMPLGAVAGDGAEP